MAIDWLQTGVIVAAAGVAYMWFFREKREEPVEEIPDFPDPENKDMTLAELSKYNGRNEEVEKRIYIGIAGKIYDVTTRPGFYGPDGPYNVFTGHDATFALARGTLDLSDMDIENPPMLKRYEYYQLQDWLGTFARYHVVGNLIDRPAPEVEPSKIPARKAAAAAKKEAEAAAAAKKEAEASTTGDGEAKDVEKKPVADTDDQQGEGGDAAEKPLPEKSLDELNKATGGEGGDAAAGLLVAVKGLVFDLASKDGAVCQGLTAIARREADEFRPGGKYALYAGHDASLALAKGSTDDASLLDRPIDGLSFAELSLLETHFRDFQQKYPVVAKLQRGVATGDQAAFYDYAEPDTNSSNDSSKAKFAPGELHRLIRNGNVEGARKIIEAGAPLDEVEQYSQMTPLHVAVEADHLELVKLLVEKGAPTDAKCPLYDNKTPRELAVHMKHNDIAEYLK